MGGCVMRDFLELWIAVSICYAVLLLGLWLVVMTFGLDFRFRWAVGLCTFLILVKMAVEMLE